MEARSRELLDRCVGENLDQLTLMDMRGDGVSRALYNAARGGSESPLSLSAARTLLSALPRGGTALLLTGFRVPPWGAPETDGLIGSAVLAAALDRVADASIVCVAEPEVTGALTAAMRAAGLAVTGQLGAASHLPHAATVLAYPGVEAVPAAAGQAYADRISPSVCAAVERPGRNEMGHYHFALGRDVSDWIAPVDDLYEEVRRRGIPTVAVGDFGNELGMGAIADAVRRETPAGADCGCGCGGGVACLSPADVTVACSVSDWGAYAIAACLSHLRRRDAGALVSEDVYRRICNAVVGAGAIDGSSNLAIPHVDGVDQDYNGRLVEMMRAVVSYPNRSPVHARPRMHRAARLHTAGPSA